MDTVRTSLRVLQVHNKAEFDKQVSPAELLFCKEAEYILVRLDATRPGEVDHKLLSKTEDPEKIVKIFPNTCGFIIERETGKSTVSYDRREPINVPPCMDTDGYLDPDHLFREHEKNKTSKETDPRPT